MIKPWLLTVLLGLPLSAAADLREPPSSWQLESNRADPVTATVAVDGIDPSQRRKADLDSHKPGTALRFAEDRPLKVDVLKQADRAVFGERQIARLRVRAAGATDLNLHLTASGLSDAVSLHIFDEAKSLFQGPLAQQRRKAAQADIWTPVVPGDSAIIEVSWPLDHAEPGLFLKQANVGYRDLFGLAGGPYLDKSHGACNIDVECPEGDDWRDEIRSVGVYTLNGNWTCTGTLVNDADYSLTPYFLTADHCGISEANASSMVVYWNFQAPSCGQQSGGSLDQNQSGATLRASRTDVDVALVELDATPDTAFNVHYSGWDRSGDIPSGTVAIHHPSTDVKSISFAFSQLEISDSCIGSGGQDSHWNVPFWDQGTTEPGSSGSGIWHPDRKRLIGFLSGGSAACGNPSGFDCYGRFDVAWEGAAASSRLKDWLDPSNTTPEQGIDGTDPEGFSLAAQPSMIEQCGFDDISIDLAVLSQGGFDGNVSLSVIDHPAGSQADLSPTNLTAPGNALLTLSSLDQAGAGDYLVQLRGEGSGLERITSIDLSLFEANATATTINQPSDGASGVSTNPDIAWDSVPNASHYRVQIAEQSSFATPLVDETTLDTQFSPAHRLDSLASYYVRVSAINSCGQGDWSTVHRFTTEDSICVAPGESIPDGDPNGMVSMMNSNQAATIDDLKVDIVIDHSYVGDLIVELTHVDSATTVRLMDRPGVDANSNFGCGGSDIDVRLDDQANLSIQDDCQGSDAYPEASYRPNEPLAAFEGLNLVGGWELFVSDNASQDTGVLQSWCLQNERRPQEVFHDRFEQ